MRSGGSSFCRQMTSRMPSFLPVSWPRRTKLVGRFSHRRTATRRSVMPYSFMVSRSIRSPARLSRFSRSSWQVSQMPIPTMAASHTTVSTTSRVS